MESDCTCTSAAGAPSSPHRSSYSKLALWDCFYHLTIITQNILLFIISFVVSITLLSPSSFQPISRITVMYEIQLS